MKSKIVVLTSSAVLAIGLASVGPLAANAVTYVPPQTFTLVNEDNGLTTLLPGGTALFTISDGTFEPNEEVTFTLTGVHASGATLAAVAVETSVLGTKTASEAGGVEGSVTFPSDANGTYHLVASGSIVSVSADVTVTGATNGGDSAANGIIATSGVDANGLYASIWAGVGLVVIGGAAVALTRARRNAGHTNK